MNGKIVGEAWQGRDSERGEKNAPLAYVKLLSEHRKACYRLLLVWGRCQRMCYQGAALIRYAHVLNSKLERKATLIFIVLL